MVGERVKNAPPTIETKGQNPPALSAKQLILKWRYAQTRAVLKGMLRGSGLPDEVARLLAEPLRDYVRTHLPGDPILEKGSNQFLDEWFSRSFAEAGITGRKPPAAEPEILKGLIRAQTVRRVRTLTKQSQRLRGTELGAFLWARPKLFLALKLDWRFPKSSRLSSDERIKKQVEFLARRIAAVLAGYKPATGYVYLSQLERFCKKCGRPGQVRKPAVLGWREEDGTVPWCGEC